MWHMFENIKIIILSDLFQKYFFFVKLILLFHLCWMLNKKQTDEILELLFYHFHLKQNIKELFIITLTDWTNAVNAFVLSRPAWGEWYMLTQSLNNSSALSWSPGGSSISLACSIPVCIIVVGPPNALSKPKSVFGLKFSSKLLKLHYTYKKTSFLRRYKRNYVIHIHLEAD